jgi:hypothetical protein
MYGLEEVDNFLIVRSQFLKLACEKLKYMEPAAAVVRAGGIRHWYLKDCKWTLVFHLYSKSRIIRRLGFNRLQRSSKTHQEAVQ